ncbi:helix-turn-helix domain-containing protein [Eisenbergiella tayi]|uniref:helix-turn-helix domain-containing protein n=1 Tax=Eisenbergiella tayi TaxID=1432052 RepID=UPI0009DE3691
MCLSSRQAIPFITIFFSKKTAAAKQLLAEGKTVTETCYLSGFNDYNNFIRTFKKITGTSPGQYQKSFFNEADASLKSFFVCMNSDGFT